MRPVQTEKQFNEAIAQVKPTVAVFKAAWCKDCHYIEPFMPEVVNKYENQVSFVQVDRDEMLNVCEEYNVLGIPSFIAFKESQELIRFVSKLQKTRDEIEQFIKRVIQVSNTLAK